MADLACDFDSQRYPTVEETAINNASVLYKRKKFFLQDLRKLTGTLGYVMAAFVYLRDLSFMSFVARTMVQHFLSDPFPSQVHLSGLDTEAQNEARAYVKLVFILAVNGFAMLFHFFNGPSLAGVGLDGLLHGGLSVQFIGERPATSVVELLILDVAVLTVQLLFHAVTCGVDDVAILQSVSTGAMEDETSSISPEVVSNGYNGNVTLLTVDVLAHFRKVMLFRARPMRISLNRNSLRVADADTQQLSGLLFSRNLAESMA